MIRVISARVRSLFALTIVLLGFPHLACRETGTPESCVGSYSGTFEGDRQGRISGTLAFTQMIEPTDLELNFVAEGMPPFERRISLTVSSTGSFAGESGGWRVGGRIEFEGCAASGTWSSRGIGMGSWRVVSL